MVRVPLRVALQHAKNASRPFTREEALRGIEARRANVTRRLMAEYDRLAAIVRQHPGLTMRGLWRLQGLSRAYSYTGFYGLTMKAWRAGKVQRDESGRYPTWQPTEAAAR
jgi:hypothetical protein